MGRAPLTVYAPSERIPNRVDDSVLREALAVRERRRVRRDTTVSVLGSVYELEQGFLAGRVVDVVYSYLDDPPRPEVEYEGKRYPLSPVDPVANSRRRRPDRTPDSGAPSQAVSFDPGCITRGDAEVVTDDEEDLDAIF
jgi:hypothetical protein